MGKKSKWNRFVLVIVVFAMFGFAQGVNAQVCPDPLPALITGPVNFQEALLPPFVSNGFPQWIMDQTGLALQICLDVDNCFFDPVIAGNDLSLAIGFGAEAFWWLADANITVPAGDAILTLAAEAAWSQGDPLEGTQFPFTRLRIRIDTDTAGTYTVTHPYGIHTFAVTPATVADGINTTIDSPIPAPTFGISHASLIGNFLQSLNPVIQDPPLPPMPAGYIGDQRETTVIGSSCTPALTNIFRVQADGVDLGLGEGVAVETAIFTPQGRIYPWTPTIVDSSTYSRNALGEGQIDVFARSLAGAGLTVDVSVDPMTEDTSGGIFNKFFAHLPFTDLTTLPGTVLVSAAAPSTPDYGYLTETITADLVDIVTIARAVYTPNSNSTLPGTLTIVASSSDKYSTLAQPLPDLTATDPDANDPNAALGPAFTNGSSLPFTAGPIPPKTVKVTSAMGGSDTAKVMVVSNSLGVCQGDVDVNGVQDGLDLDLFSDDFGRNDCP